MKRAWLSLTACLFCVCSLGAVLYGGAAGLDSGGGFISFSPGLDILFWGFFIVVLALASIAFFAFCRPGLPRIPVRLQVPASYAAGLGVLSAAVLLLGALGLLPGYASLLDLPVHIPFWIYVPLLAVAWVAIGYGAGRRSEASLRTGLLWGLALTVFLVLLGIAALKARWDSLAPLYNQMTQQWRDSAMNGCGFVQHVMDTLPGAILARINLPASVLLGAYEWDYYDLFPLLEMNPAVSLTLERGITLLSCLLPPALFTAGWVLGWRRRT